MVPSDESGVLSKPQQFEAQIFTLLMLLHSSPILQKLSIHIKASKTVNVDTYKALIVMKLR